MNGRGRRNGCWDDSVCSDITYTPEYARHLIGRWEYLIDTYGDLIDLPLARKHISRLSAFLEYRRAA